MTDITDEMVEAATAYLDSNMDCCLGGCGCEDNRFLCSGFTGDVRELLTTALAASPGTET